MNDAKRSIRYRLMRVIAITTTSVLVLTFAFFFLYEFISYREITERQLQTIGQIIASNSTAAIAFDSHEDAHEILSALSYNKNIEAACIYDADGKIFTSFLPSDDTNLPIYSGQEGFIYSFTQLEGFIPVHQGKMRLGTLYVRRDLDDLFQRIVIYSLLAFVIMGGSFALVVLLSKRLQARISQPIISLSETSRAISTNRNYSIRAEKFSDDEIGILADAFNNMVSEIQLQNEKIDLARRAAERHSDELELKVVERTLEYKLQKDFAETVVNSSLVLIAVYDIETRFIAYNDRCEEEFRLSRSAVLNKKYLDVFPGTDGSLTYESILRCLKGEVVHNAQYKSAVTGNFYESYMVPLYDENNIVYAVLMTANNITDIVLASDRMHQKNIELQKTNEALEQFAYITSHDLQEPLRKIKVFTQLLKGKVSDPEASARYMQKVESSADRMMALIHDVLEYSRVSRLQESFTDVDLNAVIENVKIDFELLISERAATIRHDSLPSVQGNKLQLHQLLANLVSNSLKFSEANPIITITSRITDVNDIIQLGRLPKPIAESYVEIMFTDNGIGFEQEYADKIFAIFQRLNSREKYRGTGIGLALCKKIVENHSGHIAVHSTLGMGTVFTILLPVTSNQR